MTNNKSFEEEVTGTLAFIVENMATKQDIADVRAEMATKEDFMELTNRVRNLEKSTEEILDTLRPMSQAQDSDSLTIVDHEHRIVKLEEAVAV